MGVTERRKRDRQAVQKRILDAARELFVKDGYEAVTMRGVAQAIEYSPTALYFHFKDKETLIRTLCANDFLILARRFQTIAKEPDPIIRLRKMGGAYVDFAVKHPNHYRLMFMTSPGHLGHLGNELEKGNPQEDAYALLLATVSEALAQGRLRAETKDPALVAQTFWSAVHGVVALHLARREDPWIDWTPVRKLAATVIDSVLRGVAAHRDHATRRSSDGNDPTREGEPDRYHGARWRSR